MNKIDYIENYLNAYKEMRDAAVEKIKNYGKTLEVYEEIKKLIMKEQGYKRAEDIPGDVFEDYSWEKIYYCVYEEKHNFFYCCRIVMVRYNETENDVDVYLEDDDGGVAEWFPAWEIGFDKDAIYMTILNYL